MNMNDAAVPAYEVDYARWMAYQLDAMTRGRFDDLDVENLLKELGGALRSGHRELRHRLQVILLHLLKCQYQAHRRGASWRSTLSTQRSCIELLLEESPSMRRLVAQYAAKAYSAAVREAVAETGLPTKTFPNTLPYTAEEILGHEFIPGS